MEISPALEKITGLVNPLGIAILLIFIKQALNELHRLTESVQQLNLKMAGVLPTVKAHEKRIDHLESRVGALK